MSGERGGGAAGSAGATEATEATEAAGTARGRAAAALESRAPTGLPFTKMHGLGNDYVFVDGHETTVDDPAALARRVSDRRRGIGSDGLILLLPPEEGGDVRMRMFNADGSEAEMCGNGIRCLARMAVERGRATSDTVRVETAAGPRRARCRRGPDDRVASVTVDMGEPAFGPRAVGAITAPAAGRGASDAGPAAAPDMGVAPAGTAAGAAGGAATEPAGEPGGPVRLLPAVEAPASSWWLVSMGNPHAVAFVPDAHALSLETIGPAVESHPAFPARLNVHLATVRDRGHLVVRTWERGSGATDACGTGACAVAVAAARAGLADRAVRVTLPGGDLDVRWRPDGGVDMTGPAVESFRGVYAPA